ncbi:hypothetical protein ACWIUH_05000 [Ursidibacter arcticus]
MNKLFILIINVLLTLASLAYPLGWLFLASRQELRILVLSMAILWAFKAIQAVNLPRYFALFMVALLSFIYLTQTLGTMFWYPIIINAMLLVTFGGSLFSSQSLVERLARLKMPDLPHKAVLYTRKVTQVWCGFFIFNIVVSSVLIAIKNYEWWAVYTGGISYGLMGLLMLTEWLVRQKMIKNG